MNLVQEYFVLVNEVVSYRETVYDGATAEVHNRKVKRMSANSSEIHHKSPEPQNEFYELLANENKEIRLWVAHHILEHMNYERSFRKTALKEIRSMARTDKTAYGFGEKV